MVYFPLFAFLSVFSFAEGNMFKAPNQKTPVMTTVSRRESANLPSLPYLRLPVYLDSRLPLVDRQHFSPVRGTGHELLPDSVREVLLPAPPPPAPPGAPPASVTTSCQLNKMVVQVPKSVLNSDGAHDSRLKLGTCHASNSTKNYIYFEYDLSLCGTKRKMIDNRVVYSNILQFDPPKLQGPIRRIAPFTLPVACHFNRYQYSYKVGYTPKMQMRKIFKAMRNRVKFTLTARNAQWERLTPSDPYVLGQPMYFEVEGPSMRKDQRLYLHSCYATQDKSHTSKPQFPVVNNFGCMVESKEARSRFHPHKNNAVRFSVDAFVFKGMTEELYMHCTMSTGSSVPTPTMKSCNYDSKAGRWVELHGKDAVCDCCDSACTPAAPVETKMISSRPWTIKPKLKPPTTLKRKTVSTTTTTTTTTTTKTTKAAAATTTTSSSATTPLPMTAREVTERTATPRPKVTPATLRGKVEDVYLPDLRWPFGGKGVTWVEEEVEEKSVRGSAVVGLEEEEEEEEEGGEEITEPYRTFEDIFEFE